MSINKLTKLSLLIIFITISHLAKSQDTIVTYMDNHWKPTNIENAQYIRKAFKNKDKKWEVNDYYMNGNLQMTGFYKTSKLKKEEGNFQYYYKEGGVKNEGNYHKGKYVGEWRWYRPNGSLASKEFYKLGELENFTFWNEDGSVMTEKKGLLQQAEFIGGDMALRQFIASSVKYPIEAQTKGIQGKVYIQFIIDLEGNVTEVKVVKSVNEALDKEAMRVIAGLPKWIPGKRHNLPVKISYTVPINFVLQ